MPRPSVPIDEEVLRWLYVDEGLTAERIAQRFGSAAITIFRRLRRFGIPARSRGPVPRACSGEQTAWSGDLAYAVGLMATDGNLSPDHRHMSFVSHDRDLVETLRHCLGLETTARTIRRRTGGTYFRVQWCSRRFYDWLVAIGLTPAKSLTLGPLAVPDEFFADFFRGCIDGDGTILVYTDRYHTAKKETYVYERLYVSLVSASRPFVDWIRARIGALVGVEGDMSERRRLGANPSWVLRYAKAESIRVIGWMYHSERVPCLARKRTKAERFLSPLGFRHLRPVGRPRVGWLYNVVAADRESGG